MSDRRRRLLVRALAVFAGAAMLAAPLSLDAFWLQSGLFAMAAMVGAIGLGILFGTAGQMSLGHAFFVAIGAYAYVYLSAQPAVGSSAGTDGLGWPPVVALVGAIALAGVAGALFSPIASRLGGIYLGLASLGLVFLGQHILVNAEKITGGYTGRNVEPFELAGFRFANDAPESLVVLGVEFGQLERLWYLGILLIVLAWWWARNLKKSRHGRAFVMIRDSEVAASSMGVDVGRYKAAAFIISSMYAGLAGVLLAVVYGRVVPESFGFLMSVDFLIMVVLGGAASTRGVMAGAAVITLLSLVLAQYSTHIPFVGAAGSGSFSAADLSRIIYGVAIILVLLYAPGGLAGAANSLRRRWSNRPRFATSRTVTTNSEELVL